MIFSKLQKNGGRCSEPPPWGNELSTHGLKRGRQTIYSIMPTNKTPRMTIHGERRQMLVAG